MAVVTVEREEAVDRGWDFTVRVESGATLESTHLVRLAWADYDHWTAGRVPPANVAEGVVRFALTQGSARSLPATIDAARLRRRHPEIDTRIGDLIRD